MKKNIAIFAVAGMVAFGVINVEACPVWECQLDINDYSCGGVHTGCGGGCYNETSVRQPIYCQYCGHEMWDCVCGSGSGSCYNYDYYCSSDYNYDYGYAEESYSECSGGYSDYSGYGCSGGGGSMQMGHWANIRDCSGCIIGQAGCGDTIEIIGDDCNDSSRVIIYDYDCGIQGSVLRECVYGYYSWDGTGDNGYYNSYQGENASSWDSCSGGGEYVDCSYNDYESSGSGSCGGGSYIYTGGGCLGGTYVSYSELVSVYRQYVMATSGCIPMCR